MLIQNKIILIRINSIGTMELLLHILRKVPIEKFCNLLTLYVHRGIDRIKSLFELVIKVINQYIQCTLNSLELHNSAKL